MRGAMNRMLRPAGVCLLVCCAFGSTATFAQPLREVIDAEVRAVWEREKVSPAPLANDATFLRRVYLDLTGIIPTADETATFLADADPAKRDKLIDKLLDSPRYAIHQADVWDMVFFGRNPPSYDAPKREGFQNWLRDSFAKNMPYDQLARTMLRAEGNTAQQGAPMYLLQYDRQPEDAAMAVSQTFLGVQLQCARCHDHPFEPWKQREFYGMAAFFARLVRVQAGKEGNLDKLFVGEMNTGDVKFTGSAKDAKPGKQGEPIAPKFLAGDALEEPDLKSEFKDEKRPKEGEPPPPPKFSRKDKLADWVTSSENRLFARAAVNRVWAQYMGRGIVHPVDNMSESNAPTHPKLLDSLASEFAAHKFDLKWLAREILGSQTYQLASTGSVSEPMPRWFERARIRPLSAEELLESWRVATGYDDWFAKSGKKADKRFYGVTWDYVRNYFGEPNNGVGDFQGGMYEHLYLNNGELTQLIISEKGALVESLASSSDPWEPRVEKLFLATLNRKPSDDERARFVEFLSVKENGHERLKDTVWALLSCSEFRFNH